MVRRRLGDCFQGLGVFVVVHGPLPEGDSFAQLSADHTFCWRVIGDTLLKPIVDRYPSGAKLDPAPKAINALRFVSHDADAVLNDNAKIVNVDDDRDDGGTCLVTVGRNDAEFDYDYALTWNGE